MLLSVITSLAAFAALIAVIRRSRVSLGLAIAYMGSLLLLHVPGAIAHLADRGRILTGREFTTVGMQLTAIGCISFVIGVWLAHFRQDSPEARPVARTTFWHFCLFAGWLCTVIGFVLKVPTIGALIQGGGPVWMLGTALALRSATVRRDVGMFARWLLALTVYPSCILLLGGFLSYGTTAVVIVLSSLVVTDKNNFRVFTMTVLAGVIGISVFISYFGHRQKIRDAVWGGANSEARIEATLDAARDITLFDPSNPEHLKGLDARLNQNFFVGVAAARIASHQVDYLYGRSLWEGMQALVPRALWPEKPVYAGSGNIVVEMTGLRLAKNTSWGVGQVMEFHINFGVAGVIVGFLLLGLALGRLDILAAVADSEGNLGETFLYFLPGVALVQPNGSIVELIGGAAAAVAAAFICRWMWHAWPKPVASVQAGRLRSAVGERQLL